MISLFYHCLCPVPTRMTHDYSGPSNTYTHGGILSAVLIACNCKCFSKVVFYFNREHIIELCIKSDKQWKRQADKKTERVERGPLLVLIHGASRRQMWVSFITAVGFLFLANQLFKLFLILARAKTLSRSLFCSVCLSFLLPVFLCVLLSTCLSF